MLELREARRHNKGTNAAPVEIGETESQLNLPEANPDDDSGDLGGGAVQRLKRAAASEA